MNELDAIVNQVNENCGISDSRHAGLYSICGLALRLRDLYKWEKGMEPWMEDDSSKVLNWIGEKEEEWDRLSGEDFREITISGSNYDPFDSRGINEVLEQHGYFYGAGYVQSLKPTFFLAVLEEKRRMEGYPVYILGRELARDLLTVPALVQDECVVVRKASAKFFFWDQVFYVTQSGRQALKFALENYGVRDPSPKKLRSHLERIFDAQIEGYIYHELGELQDEIFDRDTWREVIAAFPHTPIELLARGVKDLLADTNPFGTLAYIIRERKKGTLGFYVAFMGGFAKVMFPEIINAFKEFVGSGQWEAVEEAVFSGYSTAKRYAEDISSIFQEGKERDDMKWTASVMEECLLRPLGIERHALQEDQ